MFASNAGMVAARHGSSEKVTETLHWNGKEFEKRAVEWKRLLPVVARMAASTPMSPPTSRNRLRIVLIVLGVIVIIIVGVWWWRPLRSGVLASLRLPDGSEYALVQRFNWSAEPFTVSFYMRTAGGTWGWCYIDHESMGWSDVVMTYDPATDCVVVTESGTKRVVLDRKTSTFWMDNGQFNRSLPAPQEAAPQFKLP